MLSSKKQIIDLPLRMIKISNNFSYTIESGGQVTEDNTEKLSYSISSNRIFHGHCYNCGCMKHSQNYCPLKMCSICAKFGHDQRVCFFNLSRRKWTPKIYSDTWTTHINRPIKDMSCQSQTGLWRPNNKNSELLKLTENITSAVAT